MDNYGISKTPWHAAVTVLVLICLAGLAFWISRKEPIYRMHFFKKHDRAIGAVFGAIVITAFLVFDYVYELVYLVTLPDRDFQWPVYIHGIQIAPIAAFVFLRHASRFETCAKICAGGLAALCTLAWPWPNTIIGAGALALFYAIDYVVVRPHRQRKRVAVTVRTVSAALFIIVLTLYLSIFLVIFYAFYIERTA